MEWESGLLLLLLVEGNRRGLKSVRVTLVWFEIYVFWILAEKGGIIALSCPVCEMRLAVVAGLPQSHPAEKRLMTTSLTQAYSSSALNSGVNSASVHPLTAVMQPHPLNLQRVPTGVPQSQVQFCCIHWSAEDDFYCKVRAASASTLQEISVAQ